MENHNNNYYSQKFNWVGDWAKMRADINGDDIAVYDFNQGKRFTFADVNRRANLLANILINDFDIQVGDTICILSKNRIEHIDLFFACGKAGIILSPISFHADKSIVIEQVKKVKPKLFFYEGIFTQFTEDLELDLPKEKHICIDTFSQLYANARFDTKYQSEINTPLALNDTAMLIPTSGSTGTPKICKISHRQIIWNIFEVISFGYWAENNKELVLFPLYLIGGINSFLSAFIYGRESVLVSEFYSTYACQAIQQENISHFGGVNVMLDFMKRDELFNSTPFEKLNGITIAGTPGNKEIMDIFLSKGIPVAQAYGLTEAGPSNFSNPGFGGSLDDLKNNADSIGYPMLYCDYKICGPQQNPEVKDGEKGTLALRSLHNFNGYLENDELTNKTISSDGWINSSDIASKSADNAVKIHGRLDSIFEIFSNGGTPENYDSLKMDWVGNTLSKRAAIAPNETSLFDHNTQKQLTLSELDSITNTIANNLLAYNRDKFAINSTPTNQLLVFLAAAKVGKVIEIVPTNNSHGCDYIIVDDLDTDSGNAETISIESLISGSSIAPVSTAKAMNETALIIESKEITYNDLYWDAFRLYTFANLSALKSFTIIADSFSSTAASLAFALINMGVDLAIIGSDNTEENASLINNSDYLYIDSTVDENSGKSLASSSNAELLFTNCTETNIPNKNMNKVLNNDGFGIAGFSIEKNGKHISKSFPYIEA